ncbi:helix-turn-helix domain-containing protein [Nocardiopsis sp. MT53]|uniref:Helix-turn-helix transcriptional regulator n=1 Tax=Nocardiopsis changdeensis TaxID=2831969 RepID=A0ABX8BKS6_9ACTN|nr:helix-turn-helix transcriptional regulator [Nocardiopsis changdeensis]QYX38559.1 helix-turn-helix domain-containing protein [Nocardiopsis sp. MT53]
MQRALARVVGVADALVSRCENGVNTPSGDIKERLGEVLRANGEPLRAWRQEVALSRLRRPGVEASEVADTGVRGARSREPGVGGLRVGCPGGHRRAALSARPVWETTDRGGTFFG